MSVPWLKGSQRRAPAAGRTISAPSAPNVYAGGVKDPTGKTSEYSSMDDECPVCKSDRYLNPKLRLLVSSCYHKMCESCIDRLFTLGPQGCPICGKVLRKMAFAPQTFEDLVVEKEVAVRRRMAKEFNKRREDFTDLRAYNNYLEEVEDITFNLINDHDIPGTEARIAKFREENAALIELNIQREERDAALVKEEEDRVRREHQERAEEARILEEEERLERAKDKKDIIDSLQSSDGSAAKVIAKTRAAAHRRAQQKPSAASVANTSAAAAAAAAARLRSSIKDEPHVAFTDDWYAHQDKFVLRPSYRDPGTDGILRSVGAEVLRAGGYDVSEIWERAIRCGVAGLAVTPLTQPSSVGGLMEGLEGPAMDVEMVAVG